MGEAKRRRLEIEAAKKAMKMSPRQHKVPFRLVHHNRVERQSDDGRVFVQHAFVVVNDDGDAMVEETPDGPKPVILLSAPQPVRQTVLTPTLARV
jgi:hypothetical protein